MIKTNYGRQGLKHVRRMTTISWRNKVSSMYVTSRGYRNQWSNPNLFRGDWKQKIRFDIKIRPYSATWTSCREDDKKDLRRKTRNTGEHKGKKFLSSWVSKVFRKKGIVYGMRSYRGSKAEGSYRLKSFGKY